MKICKRCNNEHTKNGIFCSRSCASSRGPRSESTRQKIRKSLKGREGHQTQRSEEEIKTWKNNISMALQKRQNSRMFDEVGLATKRARIFKEQEYKCNHCKLDSWCGNPIKLEIEHKDGNTSNNARENLEGICPNCHSFTETYKVGNNKSNGKRKHSDEEIIEALQKCSSTYQAIKELGLNPHGGNYTRFRNIVKKHKIKLSYSV